MFQVNHGGKPECLSDMSDFPEVADNNMPLAEQINAFLDETKQQALIRNPLLSWNITASLWCCIHFGGFHKWI